jgi:hypothetical protein
MTIHICRDFLTLSSLQHSTSMYITSCFAIGVLGFTQVGHTNYNIAGSALVSTGVDASISSSSGLTSVTIPSVDYSVSTDDVNRILALKSDLNPTYNSGLFRIQSVDTTDNKLNIDYRTSENSKTESATLKWTIFESEQNTPGTTEAVARSPNGSSGYRSTGAGFNGPRIILQSPHSSSWQVRFCQESSTDHSATTAYTSIAVGFSGSSIADFPAGSFDLSQPQPEHTHGPAWFDTSDARYRGLLVGINGVTSAFSSNVVVRYNIWGDDEKGTCIVTLRNVTNYADFWFAFGLPDYEVPTPLLSQKLFCTGFIPYSGNGDINWDIGYNQDSNFCAVTFGLTKQPEPLILSRLVFISDKNTIMYASANGTNNTMIGATELQDVEMYSGLTDTPRGFGFFPQNTCVQFSPRFVGTFPIAKTGRHNFGNWQLSTDTNKSWFHLKNGVYLPWEGPAINP